MSIQKRPNPGYEAHRQAALQINELAGRIQSEADARALVDGIARVFSDELPVVWKRRTILDRIARAEYAAAVDPAQYIPEERVSNVWNKYVVEIDAPEETRVSAAEIHSMRDASYASAQVLWRRSIQTIWTMPNIFAISPSGKIADGCRALEALRVIHDIASLFENVRGARERLAKGVVASDWIDQLQMKQDPSRPIKSWLEARASTNPLRAAEIRYLRERGTNHFDDLLEELLNELFPSNNR